MALKKSSRELPSREKMEKAIADVYDYCFVAHHPLGKILPQVMSKYDVSKAFALKAMKAAKNILEGMSSQKALDIAMGTTTATKLTKAQIKLRAMQAD